MKVEHAVEPADVEGLRGAFAGQVLLPADDGYEQYRKVWNAMIDRRPSVILRCAGTQDLVRAIRFARERGLPVTVRGGGHNVAGLAVADGAVMIDLSAMRAVDVDPTARTATVQGGATWKDLDAATAAHGLAVTGGHVGSTGVGGLTLGGGIGWLHGKLGLASDNLIRVELVTADGNVVTASDDENGDLFWALRGGGGNFGVATSFTFRLHPIDVIFVGIVLYPRSRAKELIEAYDAFIDACPDELTSGLLMLTAPELAIVPPELQGTDVVQIVNVYSGAVEDGERVIKPLLDLGPTGTVVQPMAYTDIQSAGDEMWKPGMSVYWKSGSLDALDGAAGVIAAQEPSPSAISALLQMGGKVAQLPADATAFGQRHSRYTYLSVGLWEDPAQSKTEIARVRKSWNDIQPHVSGAYVNFINPDGDQDAGDAYDTAQQQRLASIKRIYDPDNFFRANINITPS